MAQTTYQVILSTDGKHTIIVTTDDAAVMHETVAWATTAYDRLVARYGPKHEQYHSTGTRTGAEHANGQANADDASAPICGVRLVPMARMNGKLGPFWSCYRRNADGSFCSY